MLRFAQHDKGFANATACVWGFETRMGAATRLSDIRQCDRDQYISSTLRLHLAHNNAARRELPLFVLRIVVRCWKDDVDMRSDPQCRCGPPHRRPFIQEPDVDCLLSNVREKLCPVHVMNQLAGFPIGTSHRYETAREYRLSKDLRTPAFQASRSKDRVSIQAALRHGRGRSRPGQSRCLRRAQ
jgi:hypothetical protein